MGKIIGIDLGTTYSVVTVPGEYAGDGFDRPKECRGYSIIRDRNKLRVTPSVVAENTQGQIVVGHAAKGYAGMSPEPIMFSKRWMGEEKYFQLAKQGTLTPVDAAAYVLGYLKEMAEAQLKEPVEEAVITIPAYFSLTARQMTEKAAVQAGLRVAQLAPEPVAAALMYCAGDPRDPLTIMTYDLGGGTFDVAILEKRDGIISTDSILAFDGNRFLGGYDFDHLLVQWLLCQLCARGYQLELNLEKPADRVVNAKLMVIAERIKIRLTDEEVHEVIDRETGIKDHAGNPVTIELTITREEFEDLIRDRIEETIELCHRAKTQAQAAKAKKLGLAGPAEIAIDEIVMVGGSSRIPYVRRRMEEEFGRKPNLVMPDLCVALGAAIIAGAGAISIGNRLKLDPIPEQTELPGLTITGRVVPGDGFKEVAGCRVRLRAADGSYDRHSTAGETGGFAFGNVNLAPEEQTDFELSVASPGGVTIAGHSFSVRQTSQAAGATAVTGHIPTNMLSKPIFIDFADGPHEVAAARTPLPYVTTLPAETADTSGQIRLRVREDNTPLGQIVMSDIPPELAIGSGVEVKLTIQENYQVLVEAYVPSLARRANAVMDLPVRPQKSHDELRKDLENIIARFEDARQGASPDALFGAGRRWEERREDVSRKLGERADQAAIQDRLDEMENLIREMGAGWRPEPPRAAFNLKADEANRLIGRLTREKPEAAKDGYDQRLAAIRAEAEHAYAEKNTQVWKDSFHRVVKLCDDVHGLLEEDEGGGSQITPAQALLILGKKLDALADWAKAAGRYERFKTEFAAMAHGLKQIKPDARDAMVRIIDFDNELRSLKQKLDAPESSEDEGWLRRRKTNP